MAIGNFRLGLSSPSRFLPRALKLLATLQSPGRQFCATLSIERRLGWHSNITVEFSGPQTDIDRKIPQKGNITSWPWCPGIIVIGFAGIGEHRENGARRQFRKRRLEKV